MSASVAAKEPHDPGGPMFSGGKERARNGPDRGLSKPARLLPRVQTILWLTVLHLGTPQLMVSNRTLNLARKFLVPAPERADFEFLAAKNIWSNTPLKLLLQHVHLANYNRTLVNWKLPDEIYREFVLSPEIFPLPGLPATRSPSDGERDGVRGLHEINWRLELWEHFYPRIRKESSLEAAAEIVVRNLNEVCRRRGNETNTTPDVVTYKTVLEIWRSGNATDTALQLSTVAALRSVGIPARLSEAGPAEFWNGTEWSRGVSPHF